MKKYRGRFLALFLSVTMLLSMIPAMAFSASAAENTYSGGSGTESDPYQISTREDLAAIAEAVNGRNDLAGLYFEQTNDIDLGGEDDPWPVIGHVVGNTPHPFNGVYNGGDYNIYGLFVASGTDEDGKPVGVNNEDAGLFGHVGEKGIIRRVHVVDCQVYNKALYVGGIAGRNEGLVEYCSSDATDPDNSSGVVHGSWQYAGGIVGYNHDGTIRYCYSNCDVYGAQKVGGITGGQNGGTVVNCYFRGYVYADDITRAYAGGIAGENDGDSTINNCYCDGTVEGRNENAYCGGIAGSNDTGSTVGNCFWESSEETDIPGIGSGQGKVDNVEERTEEEFASGQVAWELAHGTDGEGWGQTLEDEDGNHDNHPHFTQAPDKDYETTAVYRVTLKAPSLGIDETLFVDPDVDITLPDLRSENAKWYLVDADGNGILGSDGEPMVFNGDVTDHDVDAVGGERILFAGEAETITVVGIYNTAEYTLTLDLDEHMEYAERGPSAAGRFEYEITGGNETLQAKLSEDGNTLTIPERTNVKEGGYTLTVNAHEKKPFIAPLSLGPFGTGDVELTVNVIINKADPVITVKPTASELNYGQTLADSTFTGGEAQHPMTEEIVAGRFAWTEDSTVPTVNEAANVGYSVTFIPDDTNNYNNATTFVTLNVNKVDPTDVIAPVPIDGTYNGSAQDLIVAGSAEGGTMKYWLADDAEAETPDPNAEYSSTIPARANAGTYKIWYKVVGDENHNDTEPDFVIATISPIRLTITDQHFTYNGGNTFTLTFDGVTVDGEDSSRTVVATLTAYGKDVGEYAYDTEAGEGKYTLDLSNGNYIVADGAGTLTIDKLAAIFSWSESLTFTYDGDPHEITAAVSNAVDGDEFKLEYEDNKEFQEGDYTAAVTELGNNNYTLIDAQNATQAWHILPEDESIALSTDDPITYGDTITIKADISPVVTRSFALPIIRSVPLRNRMVSVLASAAWDTVDFYINGTFVDSVTVDYYDTDNDNGTATLIIDATAANYFTAGVNAVKAEYGGNDNVTSAETAITINVAAKPIEASIIGDATTKTYDGNDVATGLDVKLDNSAICDGDEVFVTVDSFIYNSADVDYAESITAANVTLIGAQSSNYELIGDFTVDGDITPKTIGLEWRGATGLVYSGDPVNVNATAIELIPGFDCAVIVDNGQQTAAGDYVAEAVDVDNSNYALPADGTTQEYTISPAPLYIPELIVDYDGTEDFEVEVNGVTPADGITEKVNAKIAASSPDAGNYVYTAVKADDTEDKIYTASIDDTNYEIAGGAMLIINKVDPSYTAPTANDLTYNREAQELVTAGSTEDGTIKYSLTEDGEYTETIPTGIDAGEYTVWYKVFGDKNHNDTEPQSVTITIDKAEPIISPLPIAIPDLEYNGYAQDLILGGKSEDGVVVYSLSEDGPYSTDIPTGVEAGTYTVWYMVIGDSNHYDSEPQFVEVTIAADNTDDPGNGPGNKPGGKPGDKPGNEPGDKPGDKPGNKPGSSLTSPQTGADTIVFSLFAMMILSMLVVGGAKLSSLRKSKRNR